MNQKLSRTALFSALVLAGACSNSPDLAEGEKKVRVNVTGMA